MAHVIAMIVKVRQIGGRPVPSLGQLLEGTNTIK